MNISNLRFLVLAGICLFCMACTKKVTVISPDQKTCFTLTMDDKGAPEFTVMQDGEQVVMPSVLGLRLRECDLTQDLKIVGAEHSSFEDTWETVWGEERFITDRHNQTIIHLAQRSAPYAKMDIVVRVFDDGVAFRYVIPKQDALEDMVVLDEQTAWTLPSATRVWSISAKTEYYEAIWTDTELADLNESVCSPVTLELPDGRFAFLHEAALTDYPAQTFAPAEDHSSLHTALMPWLDKEGKELPDKAYIHAHFATPWRFMIITRSLPDMVASRIMLNLNEPCKIDDTSWIKPMKFLGIWWGMHLHQWTWRKGPHHGATTANMQRYLQFAADHAIGGVLAEGWNVGWEGYEGIDPTARFSFVQPYEDYDMEYLSDFARKHGVQIIAHHETCGDAAQYEQEMAEAYDYMQAHGITAVKTGYVAPIITTRDGKQYNRSQSGVRHYRAVIECAASHHVCIDNHEPVMPTGLQRTYPNLMTQEGIRGQEWNAWAQDGGSPASHVCTLPFTRMMAGPADYTPGIFGFENPVYPNTRAHATLANQLALFVTLYSPLQMACDLVENYERFPDMFQFIEQVPCDWQKSVLLDRKIGEYIVMARQDRASDHWYIGATTDEQREVTIPLSFLSDGTHHATIYTDGADADWQNNPYDYVIEEKELTAQDTLTLHLASGGGCAIALR